MPKERRTSSRSCLSTFPYRGHSSSSTLWNRPCHYEKWQEVYCSVCMEHPHNAVLLLCSSYHKGCRPFMCDTSYRHSNCLDQFRKSCSRSETTQDNDLHKKPSNPSCPLCRGIVTGWTIDMGARNYMNTMSRSCSLESCGFVCAYRELRKHARMKHPSVRPSEPDPKRQEDWKRIEEQQGRDNTINMLQSEHDVEDLISMLILEPGFNGDINMVLSHVMWLSEQTEEFAEHNHSHRNSIIERANASLLRYFDREIRGRRLLMIPSGEFSNEQDLRHSALGNNERHYDRDEAHDNNERHYYQDDAHANGEQFYDMDDPHDNSEQHYDRDEFLGNSERHYEWGDIHGNGGYPSDLDDAHDNDERLSDGDEALERHYHWDDAHGSGERHYNMDEAHGNDELLYDQDNADAKAEQFYDMNDAHGNSEHHYSGDEAIGIIGDRAYDLAGAQDNSGRLYNEDAAHERRYHSDDADGNGVQHNDMNEVRGYDGRLYDQNDAHANGDSDAI